ncbi:MAG: hypothetical protein WCI95_11925 [bacterium]
MTATGLVHNAYCFWKNMLRRQCAGAYGRVGGKKAMREIRW